MTPSSPATRPRPSSCRAGTPSQQPSPRSPVRPVPTQSPRPARSTVEVTSGVRVNLSKGAHSSIIPSSQAPPPRRPRPPARSSSSSRTSSRTPRQPSRPTRRTNRSWARGPSSRTSSSACKPTAPTSTDSRQRFRMHLPDTCSGWCSSSIKTSSTTRFTFGRTPWGCGSRARGRAWTTSVARWYSRTDRRPFARMTAANLVLRCVYFNFCMGNSTTDVVFF